MHVKKSENGYIIYIRETDHPLDGEDILTQKKFFQVQHILNELEREEGKTYLLKDDLTLEVIDYAESEEVGEEEVISKLLEVLNEKA